MEQSAGAPTRNTSDSQIGKKKVVRVKRNQIPDEIMKNQALNTAISILPPNYNFEIHKTIWRISSEKVEVVAIQFPEGLLMYACIIADIIRTFCRVNVIILGDVTYGACCVDDYTAKKLGAQMLIHYGHSCLVSVIKVMYVFVEINFDPEHLLRCIVHAFEPSTRLGLMGTVQFTSILHGVKAQLTLQSFTNVSIPQAKPLSLGETLGCTSSVISDCDAIVFVADGRFHLEAAMIRNPHVQAFRYDPYAKVLTEEGYDVELMKRTRYTAITAAREGTVFGIIFGTLGHQGSRNVFDRLHGILQSKGKQAIPFLMAEINPKKLDLISQVDVWVQVACPRLSIDWGSEFTKPVLSPYELEVCMDTAPWHEVYPMDYYSEDGGTWSVAGSSKK